MKTASLPSRRSPLAFTLIELLVVISIIGILAALLLPVLARVKIKTQVKKAQMEVGQIANAIHSYESDYSKFPVAAGLADLAAKADEDITYGGIFKTPTATYPVRPPPAVTNNVVPNSDVMAVLLNVEFWPASPIPTINRGFVKNPQKTLYLTATMAPDSNSPGVGPDGLYRDPWKNPYVITIDGNYDEKARDAFYRQQAISQDPGDANKGLNGLVLKKDSNGNPISINGSHVFEANAPVMVWSAGPDGMIDDKQDANHGANKDNVLSWKQ